MAGFKGRKGVHVTRRVGASIKRIAGRSASLERSANRIHRFIDAPPDNSLVKVTLRRLRTRLRPQMGLDDLLETMAALASSGVPYWIAGGWGVDVLVGRQTREHFDLDVVLEDYERDESRACAALAVLGFRNRETTDGGIWMPAVSMLNDGEGRRIELMGIDWSRVESAFRIEDGAGKKGVPPNDLVAMVLGMGSIDGRAAPCLSRRAQLLFHTGFPPTSEHLRDLEALGHARENSETDHRSSTQSGG
jgi:lincosamide nucleotidyltransferase A/C/D/E